MYNKIFRTINDKMNILKLEKANLHTRTYEMINLSYSIPDIFIFSKNTFAVHQRTKESLYKNNFERFKRQ